MKAVPESNAELLSVEDAHRDIAVLTAILEQRQAEQKAYDILKRPSIRKALDKLITSGACKNEEEAIERALKTLLIALK